MNLENYIDAFALLGEKLRTLPESKVMQHAITEATQKNSWFTRKNVEYAIDVIAHDLTHENLRAWLSKYDFKSTSYAMPKTIAVIMAGNIPLVGFHDFLCVVITGNNILAKLSSSDDILLPAITKLLFEIEPELENRIQFITNQKLTNFDAVVATGSNNTSRYFDYYFGKYAHIIRHNRNSIAILSGNETQQELEGLCDDIFLHFGLGCRSVSKLFVPKEYDFSSLITAAQKYAYLFDHHIYKSNLDYHKALLLLNEIPFVDGCFWMLKKDSTLYSPVSVINYETYETIESISKYTQEHQEDLQCIVSHISSIKNVIPFGCAQKPKFWDYADGKDTIQWICELK